MQPQGCVHRTHCWPSSAGHAREHTAQARVPFYAFLMPTRTSGGGGGKAVESDE